MIAAIFEHDMTMLFGAAEWDLDQRSPFALLAIVLVI